MREGLTVEDQLRELDQLEPRSQDPGAARGHVPEIHVLESLYSAEFVLHAPNNRVLTRQDVLSFVQQAARGESAFWYQSYARTTEFVHVSGRLAITMGSELVVPGSGPDAGQEVYRRFTHVYRKEDGSWRKLVRHANAVVRSPT